MEYLRQLGWSTAFGPSIAPDTPSAERSSYEQVYLYDRMRAAASRINPGLDAPLIDEAVKRPERAESQSAIAENFRVHTLLADGVPVEHRGSDGAVRTVQVRLTGFEDPANNDWLAVNQFTIVHNGKKRRPDVPLFANGIPVALFELKNLANEHVTLKARGTRSRPTAPPSRRSSRRTR